MTRHSRSRRGFTLAEIIIALIIVAILGAALTRLVIAQSRFFTREYDARNARSVARASMNLLLSELRMVQDSGGVDSVSTDGRTVRLIVPYAYGLACGTTGSATIVSLLPTDSSVLAVAEYDGYAWRNSAGRYVIVNPPAPQGADAIEPYGSPDICTDSGPGEAGIATLTINGRSGQIVQVTPAAAGIAVRTPVFLWQKITYSFASSATYPGLYGLYRTAAGGPREEILAPFDSSARFKFYVPNQDTSQTAVPPLSSIRGLDILLYGVSPQLQSNEQRSMTKMTTAVFFRNTRSF
jgi:prepilin-type N-terminal cleavage/methylation domain-containing protein